MLTFDDARPPRSVSQGVRRRRVRAVATQGEWVGGIVCLIPCHRVIGSTGKLTGYAGGLDRKRALLKIEQGE